MSEADQRSFISNDHTSAASQGGQLPAFTSASSAGSSKHQAVSTDETLAWDSTRPFGSGYQGAKDRGSTRPNEHLERLKEGLTAITMRFADDEWNQEEQTENQKGSRGGGN